MNQESPEYRWYLTGCERLGQEPLPYEQFAERWQEFEDHAEKLKAAEASGKLADVDAALRRQLQQSIQHDPFVKAMLVGMSECGDGR
jgi:hypothetical protein